MQTILPVMINIPKGATDYIHDLDIVYYKRITAFNMNLLQYWCKYQERWRQCGYHPWDKLRPLKSVTREDLANLLSENTNLRS
jgi:hypothetical protein